MAKSLIATPKKLKFQLDAAEELYRRFAVLNLHAVMLIAKTGHGKTYIIAWLLQFLKDRGFFNNKAISRFKILYVTKASVVEQSRRVLAAYGHDTVFEITVTNYDQLRSKLGELMVREYTIVERNEAIIKWEWKENVTPVFIIWDECHSLMNEFSIQSKIAQALNDLPPARRDNVYQLFTSATPFGRVSEAKCFAVATRISHKFGYIGSELTNDHWVDFAVHVAGENIDYRAHSPLACQRLVGVLHDYIYTVKGVRPKFHARNSTSIIKFRNAQEAKLYAMAWEEFQAKMAELKGKEYTGLAAVWTAILKFRQAAELIRAFHLAEAMYESVTQHNEAAVCAVNFRSTIAKVVEILVNHFGVERSKISLIWGGIEDVDELADKYQDLDLGSQSKIQRQKEIDRFQSGKSLYCLFTFRAGGVGLSLHHEFDFLRPRRVFLGPTYNAKELVQGLGRCPRLTSLSDTPQTIIFYEGTIEEEVAEKVAIKLKCLQEVVQQKENWADILDTAVAVYNDARPDGVFKEEDDLQSPNGMFIEEVDDTLPVIDI